MSMRSQIKSSEFNPGVVILVKGAKKQLCLEREVCQITFKVDVETDV